MSLEEFLSEWHNDSPYVRVHTSGSTGEPKAMLVEKRRMLASARITCDFLGLQSGNTALLCMSLDFIAGKMMVVRSLERHLQLVAVPPIGKPEWNASIDFAAMVPLQVWNLLHDPEGRQRLMGIRHLIIGGGAIDADLAAVLVGFPNHIWSTYGMTETLSHIALCRLNGPEVSDWYTPFPSVTLSINDDQCLVIDAPEVCAKRLVTNDIVEFAADGRFRIVGRKDNVICSGGIKIQAEEVERLLRPYFRVPYLISKRPDQKFGEIVVLLTEGSTEEAEQIARQVLPKYWEPRAYIHVSHIPLTANGKPARKEAESLTFNL